MSAKKILVVGSLNMDMVLHVEEMPVAGETVMGGEIAEIPGGKGANQAFATGRLGGNVEMLGAVGQDDAGAAMLENLRSAGVGVDRILRDNKRKSGIAVIYVNRSGNNCIVVSPGANNSCDIGYLQQQRQAFEECDILMVQMEIPLDAVYYAVDLAHSLGKTVILNPAPAPDGIPDEVLKKLSMITPNETELQKLSGLPVEDLAGAEKACRVLLDKGVDQVLVTLGSQGAMLATREGSEHFPVEKVKRVDTTAAGDAFNGSVAVRMAEGLPIREAIQFANRVSTIVVQRKGAQTSIPHRSELGE